MSNDLLTFAVAGHPNEGKSSVIATLIEDDSVVISPMPGATVRCQSFDIFLGGENMMRLVDTPGFQMPRRTLRWLRGHETDFESPEALFKAFFDAHESDPLYDHDLRLLRPIVDGAGIIYVLDAAKPVDEDDLAEMEILRMSARPRMAVINAKHDAADFIDNWKAELRKTFNTIRQFNAHSARFAERVALFETLKAVEQEWESVLQRTINSLKADRQQRLEDAAARICLLLEQAIGHVEQHKTAADEASIAAEEEQLPEDYRNAIRKLEQKAQRELRKLFRQNVFRPKMGASDDGFSEDLFSKTTWSVLGLDKRQLAGIGAASGALAGGFVDASLGGADFFLGAAAGALLGAAGGWFGTRPLAGVKPKVGFLKTHLGGARVALGPNRNRQFPFILLDRALLYTRAMDQRPHALRDRNATVLLETEQGLTRNFSKDDRKQIAEYARTIVKGSADKTEQQRAKVIPILAAQIALPQHDN